MVSILFFISSGLFLGWSLGSNDAANVFGTAVTSKMIPFKKAALICSIFVILGAVFGGAGTAVTLGKLGDNGVNTLPGAFTVALSAALTIFSINRLGLSVSTSQAIVGAIIGWNIFSGMKTDYSVLTTIISSWILCPILSATFAIVLFKLIKYFLEKKHIHMLRLDAYTRIGLLLVGAFASYALGANNIANIMGVFISSSPFKDINIGIFTFTSLQQLFLLGAIAISVGVCTNSKKIMYTIGSKIFKLSPIGGFVAVLSVSLVLFIFSSENLSNVFEYIFGIRIPQVPLSSSQGIVGAVMGIGIAKGGKNLNFHTIGKIAIGWVTNPIISAIISFFLLFFVQNVFMAKVYL